MEELERKLRERHQKNGFMAHNHMELESVELDHAVTRMTIRPESTNPYGIVHGGALYTMADNAAGTAMHSDGRLYVTQSSSFHYFTNQREGVVRAKATVRHRGKKTAMAVVDVVGEDDKLLATGEFSFFCLED